MSALARDIWVVMAMMRDGLDVDVKEEWGVQLSNWAARWRIEGVTEGHAYRRTQYKSGRDYWMGHPGLDILALRACKSFKWKHPLDFWC